MDPVHTHSASSGRPRLGRQLPRLAEPRPDDLDAARLRDHHVRPQQGSRSRGIQEALDKRANAISESIDQAEEDPQGSRTDPAGIPRSPARGSRAGGRDRGPAPARRPRLRRHRPPRRGPREARGAARRRPPRPSRRRRAARWSASAREGRRPDGPDDGKKVTRKTLTGDDQRKLIDEALSEVDFSILSGKESDRGGPRARDGAHRPGIRRMPSSGWPRRRGSST